MITLEKIDQVVERTGVSYAVAREALEKTEGDVLEAIVQIEKDMGAHASGTENVMDTLKDLIHKGNITRVIVEKNGRKYLDIPATAGAIGFILAPVAALIGTGLGIYADFKIRVENTDGEIVNVTDVTRGTVEKVFDRTSDVVDNVKEKAEDLRENASVKAEEFKFKTKQKKDDVIDITKEKAEEVKDGADEFAEAVKDKVDHVAHGTKSAADIVKDEVEKK